MTDPATNKVFGIAAATDLLTGVALVAVGYVVDETALIVVGLLLLLSGAGVAAYLSLRSNRPIQL